MHIHYFMKRLKERGKQGTITKTLKIQIVFLNIKEFLPYFLLFRNKIIKKINPPEEKTKYSFQPKQISTNVLKKKYSKTKNECLSAVSHYLSH